MDFDTLAMECAPWVAPKTLAAIVRTESDFKPFAINVNGGAKLERQPVSKEEAVMTAKWLLANNYNIDMGLGQVNSINLTKTGLTIEEAFDPCKNLAAAATILHWNYQSASKRTTNEQEALHAAISAYNTGSFTRGFSNGYVQKVVGNAGLAVDVGKVKPIRLTRLADKAPAGFKSPVDDSKIFKVKPLKLDVGVGVSEGQVHSESRELQAKDVFGAGDVGYSNVMVY